MNKIKRFFWLLYLTLLRFQLCCATKAIFRMQGKYQRWLSHAFQTLSRWNYHYKNEVRRYFADGKEQQ